MAQLPIYTFRLLDFGGFGFRMSLWCEDAVFLILRFALVRENKHRGIILGGETGYPSIGNEQTILKYAWKSIPKTHGMQTGMQTWMKL